MAAKKKARIKRKTRYGYRRGDDWAIEPQFEQARPFHHGLAAAMKGQKWGYIDRSGATVIDFQFNGASDYADGMFTIVNGYYIDRAGQFAFLRRAATSDGLFAATTEGSQYWDSKWGVRSADTGEWVIQPQFAAIHPFFGEYATAMRWIDDVGGRWGLVDRTGKWLIEPEHLLSLGMEARGGIFGKKVGEKEYHYGIVHPVDGVVVPFEDRYLKPDLSRQLKDSRVERLPEDLALTVDKARVAVEVTDANAFPFRFYGVGLPPSETEFEYRIQFEPGVNTSPVCEQIEMAEEPGLEASAEGQFVHLYVDPTIGYEEEFCIELLKDLHKRFPIVEVVNMIINDTGDSDWQRWSVDQQEWPNEGPRFGHSHWTWAPQP